MEQQFDNFNNDMNDETDGSSVITDNNTILFYDLMNDGLGQGWESSQNKIPNVDPDATDDGRNAAFIGTQSRSSKLTEIDDWGYVVGAANEDGFIIQYQHNP